jgi:hypothetical protein
VTQSPHGPSGPGEQPAAPDHGWDAVPPPSGWSPYGVRQPGEPGHDGGGYGQHPYPPQYGQPQYPPPQYGPPPYGPYAGLPPKNRTGLLWCLVAGLATLCLVLTVLLVVRPGPDQQPLSAPPDPVAAPAATLAPTGLGEDPDLDRLAQQCADGQMNPCDDLYYESSPGSDYEDFADTCAGRRPADEDTYCSDVFYDS